jgi:DNA-binding NarL/FixJ family response regulator
MSLIAIPMEHKDQSDTAASEVQAGWSEYESFPPITSEAEQQISVLLVDDHALVRRALRLLLEDSPDIHVVGEASDGLAAVNMAQELHPRVVVMDCALPGLSGLMATRTISKTLQHTYVLMLSMYAEDTWVRNALKFGARGYILKNAINLDLVVAVQRLAAGEIVLDPQIPRLQSLKGERAHGLTMRELQVLLHIVEGRSNREIASHLGISINTVGVHRTNIMQILNTHNAAALAAYAVDNGLLKIL